MRFGLVHRIATSALAALGLLALLTSGELHPVMTLVIALGMIVVLALPEKLTETLTAQRVGIGATALIVLSQASRLASGGAILPVAVELAAALQVVRLGTRRGAAQDQQIIILALLHLVAGTVLATSVSYGLCFVAFVFVTPAALVLSHLRREVEGNYRQGARDRTGLPVDVPRILRSRRVVGREFLGFTSLLSLPIFVFTGVLFILFPRIGLSLFVLSHNSSQRMIGFSDHVDLGNVGKLREDSTIALRVEVADLPAEPPPRIALYLRGVTLDRYDGRSWTRTQRTHSALPRYGDLVPLTRAMYAGLPLTRIYLEPIEPAVLFTTDDTVAIRVARRPNQVAPSNVTIEASPDGTLHYAAPDQRGLAYELVRQPGATPQHQGERERYLALPPNLTDRTRALARRWATGNTALEKAISIERHLHKELSYDLESPSGAASNPLDHFLFESKRGHCEYFSTAMAVMLRAEGVPTRSVNGFLGGTFNRFGRFYAVRQGEAHSWVEVWIDGVGWRRFDPTPPASGVSAPSSDGAFAFLRDVLEAVSQNWNRHVIGYDLDQQSSLLRTLARSTGFANNLTSPLANVASYRWPLGITAGALALGALARFLYLRRGTRPRQQRAATEEKAATAIQLYQRLEAALQSAGVARAPGTPPLRHAEQLQRDEHPTALDVMAVTRLYQEARFGTATLSDDDYREALARIELVRRVARRD